jgi:glycosyltransferase involved in cell wall biosynthesis
MTAVLGALVAQRLGAQLYLDIRDIFSDTLSDIFAHKPQRVILGIVRFLEKMAIRKASRVNLVSAGFLEYFRGIRSDIDYRIFTNGIDDAFLNISFEGGVRSDENCKIILYAGNIGEGQGLDKIIPDAALSLGRDYEFWVIGDGGARSRLEARLQEKEVRNVRLMDPVSREQLIELYCQADVLFLHLNDYPAFHKVLPSKIFEYAATGKPILAGVDGYSRRFIEDHVQNAALFFPCDSEGLIHALDSLDLCTRTRTAFVEEFGRSVIIRRMADDVLELARCGGK